MVIVVIMQKKLTITKSTENSYWFNSKCEVLEAIM